jgi:hypothetical protein
MTTPVANVEVDKFWFDDPEILVRYDRLSEFFPTLDQSLNEKLNSIVRLSLYISVVLGMYKADWKYLLIFAITLMFTYFIYATNQNNTEHFTEHFADKQQTKPEVTLPTKENPFMNKLFGDKPDKPPAIKYTFNNTENNKKIEKQIDDNFNENLYKDVGDVFGKNNSQREFYTMPSTSNPDDREGFQNWLYRDYNEHCKENTENCQVYDDLKRNKTMFYNPYENPVSN